MLYIVLFARFSQPFNMKNTQFNRGLLVIPEGIPKRCNSENMQSTSHTSSHHHTNTPWDWLVRSDECLKSITGSSRNSSRHRSQHHRIYVETAANVVVEKPQTVSCHFFRPRRAPGRPSKKQAPHLSARTTGLTSAVPMRIRGVCVICVAVCGVCVGQATETSGRMMVTSDLPTMQNLFGSSKFFPFINGLFYLLHRWKIQV